MAESPIVVWSNHARELKGTQQDKIRRYIELGLVEYDKAQKAFLVHPIPGSTKTTHVVRNHKQFEFFCTCQGWNMGLKKHERDPVKEPSPRCSHCGAVFQWLKNMNRERREMKVIGALDYLERSSQQLLTTEG